jgi:hypothetical protein
MTIQNAALNLFRRQATQFDNWCDWWAFILNMTKGNFQPVVNVLKDAGYPTRDISRMFAALRKGNTK